MKLLFNNFKISKQISNIYKSKGFTWPEMLVRKMESHCIRIEQYLDRALSRNLNNPNVNYLSMLYFNFEPNRKTKLMNEKGAT